MIPVSRAREIILEKVAPGTTEMVALGDSQGRVLGEALVARLASPPLDNSAMDGFALSSAGTAAATGKAPARFPVAGLVKAGDGVADLPRGAALRIMTGAPIPRGADCVIPYEDAATEGGKGGGRVGEVLVVEKPVSPGAHVRRAGEDVRPGVEILGAGKVLRPADLGLAASQGIGRLRVFRRPEVAILATGDEVVDLDQAPGEGQIYSSNSYSLAALVAECGARPRQLGIARDEEEHLESMVREGLRSDVLVTTGGISMGDYDLLEPVFRRVGVEVLFSKVAQKPGKPMTFGIWQGRPVFALPGNPVSTMISFGVYVRPALRRMMGHERIFRPRVTAVLTEPVKKKKGRTNFIRGVVRYSGGVFTVRTTGDQGSGILSSMSRANGVIVLPEEVDRVEAGQAVEVILLDAEDALFPEAEG
jgi:molybdopterin molybdotransferase